ncbi:roadblock/LC7 domain-containing protein [Actinomadura litoris]|uniref:roadblock/LC7 domain-containing protein n=1 Tax=Actinomadura litoris TaxID=2678616 RepID=UPI001565D00C|nr:roadblock/LC7 domain-containing protein [Actinomadura litoris]
MVPDQSAASALQPVPHPVPQQRMHQLSGILQNFTGRVAGVTGALLVGRDGLKSAFTGIDLDQADRAAAWLSSIHSLARVAAQQGGFEGGGLRQAVVEHDMALVFLMSTDHAVLDLGGDVVGSVLGVWARPDADVGVIAHQMSLLVRSVAEHLVEATRGGDRTHDGH